MSQTVPPCPPPAAADRTSLADSQAYCEELARRQAGNFYHAFRLLPRSQRRAMCALYAFMRVTDDLTDEPGDVAAKRAALEGWRRQFHQALAGHSSHPLHPAFRHAVTTHGIPGEYLQAVLDGVAMDLEPCRYDTFAELYRYCYHVASAVGLCCIHIWGFSGDKAREYAEAAGIAFQLTNILRDLGEDAARGRVYLPAEDLERFGYRPEQLRRGERTEAFRALMRFEAERARGYYEAARPLAGLLPPPGRAVFQVMSRTYRALLEAIVRRDYDVFSRRVRVSTWRKLWFVAGALPVRWGPG
jgi:15-cis-phytoene synthase